MNISRVFLFLCLTIFASSSFAGKVWTGEKKVVSIQAVESGGFLIRLDSEISTVCTHAGTDGLLIYPNQVGVVDAGVKSMLATALTAFSASYDVNIQYADDTNMCWGHNLRISK